MSKGSGVGGILLCSSGGPPNLWPEFGSFHSGQLVFWICGLDLGIRAFAVDNRKRTGQGSVGRCVF